MLTRPSLTASVHEPGNTLPLECLWELMRDQFPGSKCDFQNAITQRFKDLIIDTVLSVKKQMICPKKQNVFELFGYDFLIDEDLRTWLIECNNNPYFGIANDYIKQLLPKMIDDMLELMVDPVFKPTTFVRNGENDFQLIYCEQGSTFSPQPLNVRSSFVANIYPIPELTQ